MPWRYPAALGESEADGLLMRRAGHAARIDADVLEKAIAQSFELLSRHRRNVSGGGTAIDENVEQPFPERDRTGQNIAGHGLVPFMPASSLAFCFCDERTMTH